MFPIPLISPSVRPYRHDETDPAALPGGPDLNKECCCVFRGDMFFVFVILCVCIVLCDDCFVCFLFVFLCMCMVSCCVNVCVSLIVVCFSCLVVGFFLLLCFSLLVFC